MAPRTTNYLKGIAIVFVLLDHFVQSYEPQYFFPWIAGLSSGFLALFFILSGYGIFLSLERRFSTGTAGAGIIARYAFSRAARIYPLYWIALFSAPLLVPGYHDEFSRLSLLHIAGVPFVRGPHFFWFISAILQCYWLAPLLYLAIKKVSFRNTQLLAVAALAISVGAALLWLPDISIQPGSSRDHIMHSLVYPQLFMGNVIFFFIGMTAPPVLAKLPRAFRNRAGFYLSLGILLVMSHFTLYTDGPFKNSGIILEPLFFASVYTFFLFAASSPPLKWISHPLIALGVYSLPLYLFNPAFFMNIEKINLGGTIRSHVDGLLALSLMPLFVVLCARLQNWTGRPLSSIRLLFGKPAIAPRDETS